MVWEYLEDYLYICARSQGGTADKTKVFNVFPSQPALRVGVSYLQRHVLHWEHGFMFLNTPTMQAVVSPWSEQRDWVLGASSRSQRTKLMQGVCIKGESLSVSAKPEHNSSAMRVSGPGTEDGMVEWVGGKVHLETWKPQLKADRAESPVTVACNQGCYAILGTSCFPNLRLPSRKEGQ